jgi:dTDP-4-dehydrorhamnose 3,5-epimerase
MNLLTTPLSGLVVLEPKVFGDDRGFFMESFNERTFAELTGCAERFVQDNHSRSARGVLRGIHYQVDPCAQGKLVRVVQGAVFDVAVDLRRASPTFGRWYGVELSADNRRQLWIPRGFGHGFLVLSDSADFLYKTTGYYSSEHERCIAWNDPRSGSNGRWGAASRRRRPVTAAARPWRRPTRSPESWRRRPPQGLADPPGCRPSPSLPSYATAASVTMARRVRGSIGDRRAAGRLPRIERIVLSYRSAYADEGPASIARPPNPVRLARSHGRIVGSMVN